MSSRSDQFFSDVDKAMSLSTQYGWPFMHFMLHDTTLTFTCQHDQDGPKEYSLCISPDDYPQNSVLTDHAKNETTNLVHKPIHVLLLQLRDELFCKQKKESTENDTDIGYNRLNREESDDSDYKECVSGGDDDDDDGDYDGYYVMEDHLNDEIENDQEAAESEKINSHLAEDMDKVHLLYGDDSLSYRLLESIGEIDVEMNIPISFLYADTAEAWNLDLHKPLTVRLHLSSVHYLDQKDPPDVEVFQPSRKGKFGLGCQLRKILETFIRDNWKSYSNRGQQTASKSFSVPAELSSFTKDTDSKDTQSDSFSSVDDEALAQIVEMGFSLEVSRNALIITHGNVQEALDLLMNNPESCTELDMASQFPGLKPVPKPSRQLSQPASSRGRKKKKPGYGRCKSISTSATGRAPDIAGMVSTVDDLMLMPTSTLCGKNAKALPSLENGFLVQIFRYTRQRIPTLNEYCVVCDEPHIFQNGAMLQPSVCSRDLCVFAFQTLGVMVDAADHIATGAEVVVLLMKMTMAACKSSRRSVVFDPYPVLVDPDYSYELALKPHHKEFGKVQAVLDRLPSAEEMMRYTSADLKMEMDKRHRLMHPLIQWIISSNRSHIVKLPADRQIKCMKTPHQFLLLSSPPAKEAKFREEKEIHGSTYAFHGSNIENWHSIIRQGLVVASGTNKQVNGAAYGKGIYLSPSVSVSSGYSRIGYGVYNPDMWKSTSRFLTSDRITCIALCEVITSPDLKKHGDIWVCPKDCHVCTRFFFVYEDGQVGDNAMHTQVQKYKEEISKAVGYHKHTVR